MSIKVKIEKIEAKVVYCPICKKEITNMRNEYCQHLSKWDERYAYFVDKKEGRDVHCKNKP